MAIFDGHVLGRLRPLTRICSAFSAIKTVDAMTVWGADIVPICVHTVEDFPATVIWANSGPGRSRDSPATSIKPPVAVKAPGLTLAAVATPMDPLVIDNVIFMSSLTKGVVASPVPEISITLTVFSIGVVLAVSEGVTSATTIPTATDIVPLSPY